MSGKELTYNWEVVGHNRQLAKLEKDLAADQLAHASLFAGSDSIGKFSIAKKMANILQCENNYCHTCHICLEIEKGYHADTIELADNGTAIKIEEIRDILSRLHMSRQGRYKILLMQNIERMTLEAANALLKTLEDPPENVLFLLTTSNVVDILPTILSRIRIYYFHRASEDDVLSLLQKFYPMAEHERLENVCAFAMGKPGKAIRLMDDSTVYDAYKKMYNDVEALVKKPDRVNQFLYIAELVKSSKELERDILIKDFLEVLLAVSRKEMFMALGDHDRIKTLLDFIRDAQKAHDLLKRNVNKKLLLENLMLKI